MASYNNYQNKEKKETSLVNNISDSDFSKKETSVKSFESMKKDWSKFASYYRAYPDKFIDLISPPNSKINLFFYQRIMLRILFRYQNVYITMTRGSAKSFTQILALYLKCIMFPSIHLFIAAPTKMQAANISQENIEKIWEYFPLLQKEVKKIYFNKDSTKIVFHNDSKLDVVQVAASSRGGRRNGGSVEEIVDSSMKKDVLNEVVLPMMANNRLAACGGVDKNELHKTVTYVTTAGTRQSFAYEKLMETFRMMVEGKSAFIFGSGYELPVLHDQLDLDYIIQMKESETFNALGFQREYQSLWTGSSDKSLVQLDDMNECRTLDKAEHKAVNDKDVMYIGAYDVARAEGNINANSALLIFKCTPRGDGTFIKHVVNIFSFEGTHFLEQAKFLKKKVNEFKMTQLIVDINGLGRGLVDYLVTEIDENPPYSVTNDDRYDSYKTPNSIPILYALNSSTKENKASDIHNVFMSLMANQGVKFLTTAGQAKAKFKIKDADKEVKELKPYILTDLLQEEIMNLEHEQRGNQTVVKQISRSVNKDKFSALEYGLWYIYLQEQDNKKRKRQLDFDPKSLFMVKKSSLF